jgi:hypothetical protein
MKEKKQKVQRFGKQYDMRFRCLYLPELEKEIIKTAEDEGHYYRLSIDTALQKLIQKAIAADPVLRRLRVETCSFRSVDIYEKLPVATVDLSPQLAGMEYRKGLIRLRNHAEQLEQEQKEASLKAMPEEGGIQ